MVKDNSPAVDARQASVLRMLRDVTGHCRRGELIRASPDNEEYAQAILQVLHRRLEMIDGDYVVLSERPLRPRREPRPRPTIFAALQTQLRVIWGTPIGRSEHPPGRAPGARQE
jgi:hypothetical protein